MAPHHHCRRHADAPIAHPDCLPYVNRREPHPPDSDNAPLANRDKTTRPGKSPSDRIRGVTLEPDDQAYTSGAPEPRYAARTLWLLETRCKGHARPPQDALHLLSIATLLVMRAPSSDSWWTAEVVRPHDATVRQEASFTTRFWRGGPKCRMWSGDVTVWERAQQHYGAQVLLGRASRSLGFYFATERV